MKRQERYKSHKRKRKRLQVEVRSVLYSTDGMEIWNWVSRGLHRMMPSPMDIVRGCFLMFTVVSIGLILFVENPLIWFIVGGFAITSLMIHTLLGMYRDMKREREKAWAKMRKERDKARQTMAAMKGKLDRMETTRDFLFWLLQQNMAEADISKPLILQYTNLNINWNSMHFLGNVDTHGGNIYGDDATHNETHYHYGNESKMVVNYRDENMSNMKLDPVLQLLDMLVNDAVTLHPKSPKFILLPMRAAKDAGVLPMADLAWMNQRYNLKLSPVNWSDWVANENANYGNSELPPLVERFRALKPTEK